MSNMNLKLVCQPKSSFQMQQFASNSQFSDISFEQLSNNYDNFQKQVHNLNRDLVVAKSRKEDQEKYLSDENVINELNSQKVTNSKLRQEIEYGTKRFNDLQRLVSENNEKHEKTYAESNELISSFEKQREIYLENLIKLNDHLNESQNIFIFSNIEDKIKEMHQEINKLQPLIKNYNSPLIDSIEFAENNILQEKFQEKDNQVNLLRFEIDQIEKMLTEKDNSYNIAKENKNKEIEDSLTRSHEINEDIVTIEKEMKILRDGINELEKMNGDYLKLIYERLGNEKCAKCYSDIIESVDQVWNIYVLPYIEKMEETKEKNKENIIVDEKRNDDSQ